MARTGEAMNDPQLDRARGNILIVDDILSSQRALSTALMEHGYEVQSAPDGPTALVIADTDPPDLILLDVLMPEMDGYQVCQQLKSKAQTRDIPIIFVSALDEVVDKARGFKVGGVDHVTKPFQEEELLARVETHLALRNAQKQLEEQNVQFEREIAKGRQAEEALQKWTYELGEQVKKLDCIYSISDLVERPGISLAEILQGTVELIPSAWQYPEIAAARIIVEGQEFRTENFQQTAWRQASDIVVQGERIGLLEVCYLEENPAGDEGLFQKEGRMFLNAVAARLGRIITRMWAQEALTETIQLLEAILDHTHMLVAYLDPQFNFVRVNRAYAEADGRDPSFFPGKNHFDLYPYADNEALFRHVIETGEPYFVFAKPFEYAEHPERGVSYWDWSLVPLKDSAGTAAGLVLTLVNVTDRVQAQEALRESEERYRLATEVGQVAVWQMDLATDQWEFGGAVEQVTGYTAEELQTLAVWQNVTYPEDRAWVPKAWQEVVEGRRERYDVEHRVLHKDGSVRWLRVSGAPVRDENGQVTGMRGTSTDITARKRAEEELQWRTEGLIALHQIAQTLAIVTDLPAALEVVGETVARLLGATSAVIGVVGGEQAEFETLARWTRQPTPAEAEDRLFPLLYGLGVRKVLSQARTHVIADMQAQDLPATMREHLRSLNIHTLMIVPLQVRGTVIGIMGIGTDQEDRGFAPSEVSLAETIAGDIAAAIENTRLHKQAQAVAVDEERQRLAGELHDVVTQALFSASLIAETLPRVWERDPEKGRLGLEELRELTQGALTQMRALLLELRPAALAEQELDVLIRQLTDGMRARTHILVTTTVVGECSLPTEIKLALYRIAQEALNNITKHARASQAKVYLHFEPGRVTLSVNDNGSGFDPDSIEPNRLGLGIMRERAKAIGAEFRLESQRDRGTEITVTWEKAERDERPDTKPEQVPGE